MKMKLDPVYPEIIARMTYFKYKTKDSYPAYLAQVKAKHQDKIDMLKALALYARNSIDYIRANKELMNADTKEYLQELDKTLQELPIRDSKKCTIA